MSIKKEKIVVANFKMNFNVRYELQHWFTNFIKAKKTLRPTRTKLVLCPPFIYCDAFIKKVKSKNILFGVQDCFWEQKGAFTGEVSPTSLKSIGVGYVILGHSERRRYFGENNQIVNYKIKAALKAGLTPIICIGENAQEKKAEMILPVVTKQFKECFADISRNNIEKVVICYEPVWAISANKPDHLPSSNEIMGAKLLIKRLLAQNYGNPTSEKTRIIYGGSVTSKNAQEVCIEPGMDGALVGGASLLPYDIVKITQLIDD